MRNFSVLVVLIVCSRVCYAMDTPSTGVAIANNGGGPEELTDENSEDQSNLRQEMKDYLHQLFQTARAKDKMTEIAVCGNPEQSAQPALQRSHSSSSQSRGAPARSTTPMRDRANKMFNYVTQSSSSAAIKDAQRVRDFDEVTNQELEKTHSRDARSRSKASARSASPMRDRVNNYFHRNHRPSPSAAIRDTQKGENSDGPTIAETSAAETPLPKPELRHHLQLPFSYRGFYSSDLSTMEKRPGNPNDNQGPSPRPNNRFADESDATVPQRQRTRLTGASAFDANIVGGFVSDA